MKKRFIKILPLLICFVFIGCEMDHIDTEKVGIMSDLRVVGIGYNYAVLQVEVENGYDLDNKGICYAEHPNPTTSDHAFINQYRYEIGNLKYETTYYWRAYIQKGDIIVYSEVQSFTTTW